MSDHKSSYGEPVEESANVDDVVGRAHEGLADAEAARQGANPDDTAHPAAAPLASDAVASDADRDGELDPIYAQHADDTTAYGAAAEPVVHEPVDRDPAVDTDAVDSAADRSREDAPTVVAAPVPPAAASAAPAAAAAASTDDRAYPYPDEPVYPVREEVVAVAPAAAQPIFVQAPEEPRPRGNRGAAGAIGLLAAVAFGVLYLGAWLGFGALAGDVTLNNIGQSALAALTTWALWVPVVVFFIGFWLLGAIINRGRWGLWVILGILVGLAAYAGHILGQLFQAEFWKLTARQGLEVVDGQVLAPLSIVAFVLGRELTIWFGAWVSARGKRVTELNIEAQREYERTLEAGPQLVRQ